MALPWSFQGFLELLFDTSGKIRCCINTYPHVLTPSPPDICQAWEFFLGGMCPIKSALLPIPDVHILKLSVAQWCHSGTLYILKETCCFCLTSQATKLSPGMTRCCICSHPKLFPSKSRYSLCDAPHMIHRHQKKKGDFSLPLKSDA